MLLTVNSEQEIDAVKPHHKLHAWQDSINLVKDIYEVSQKFPPYELYGLSSQMRRAAVSIPSNIAEGAARKGTKEFLQFLAVAQGSLSELETQLIVARELNYIPSDHRLFKQTEDISKLLYGLSRYIKDKK